LLANFVPNNKKISGMYLEELVVTNQVTSMCVCGIKARKS
jgi:hypothetical protein